MSGLAVMPSRRGIGEPIALPSAVVHGPRVKNSNLSEDTMRTAKKKLKTTKSLRKGKKLESQASPITFKLVAVKTIGYSS
jgi:hypothetical protein